MSPLSSAAAVVRAPGDVPQLGRALMQLRAVPVGVLVVVVSERGSHAEAVARSHGARVAATPEAGLGGAAFAAGLTACPDAAAYLFADARLPYPAEWLAPFFNLIAAGADVVLDGVTPSRPGSAPVDLCRAFLHSVCGAPHLGCASLSIAPFALSGRAARLLGDKLKDLPDAMIAAHMEGLHVALATDRPRIAWDPLLVKPAPGGSAFDPRRQASVEAYLEAMARWLAVAGPRAGMTDHNRRRDLLERGVGDVWGDARAGAAGEAAVRPGVRRRLSGGLRRRIRRRFRRRVSAGPPRGLR